MQLCCFCNRTDFLKNVLGCLYLGSSTPGGGLGEAIYTNSVIHVLSTSSPVINKNLISTYAAICIIWVVIYKLLTITPWLLLKEKKKKDLIWRVKYVKECGNVTVLNRNIIKLITYQWNSSSTLQTLTCWYQKSRSAE